MPRFGKTQLTLLIGQTYAAVTAAAAAKGIAMLHTPTDKSIRKALDTSRPESILPFTPDPQFVGGSDIFTWLGVMSRRGGERVALVGLGGIGKSQLAIQFAHAIRNRSHVFWVNASTWDTLESSYYDIAERLGLTTPGRAQSPTDTLRKVGNWLSREENGRWTVILDNFDDASILPAGDPQLMKLLPQAGHGFVLITSRTSTAADKLTGSSFENLRQVPPMGEEEAMELFRSKIFNRDAFVEGQARELVRLLGFVPLAISQAAAYINRPAARMSVRGYADVLRGGDAQKSMVLLSSEYQERRRYAGASNAILTTWMVTLDKIQRERPRATDLLSLMSFFDPGSIPVWVLKRAYDYNAQNLPRATHRDAFFLTKEKHRYTWHKSCHYEDLHLDWNSRLWTEWVELEPGPKYRGEFRLPLGFFTRLGEFDRLARLDREAKDVFPFTLLGHTQAHDDSGSVNDTAGAGADEKLVADLETLMGYSLVAPSTVEGMLEIHPLVRTCTHMWLTRAGQTAQWKKRYMLAMASFGRNTLLPDRSLSIYIEPLIQEEPGPDDAFGAHVWVILASHLRREWDAKGNVYDASEKLLDRMIAVADKALGPYHTETFWCLATRAESFYEQEKYDEATPVCEDVCDRAAKDPTSKDRTTKVSYFRFEPLYRSMSIHASILLKRGRFAEAEKEFRTLVGKLNKRYGEGHDRTLGYLARHVTAMVQADMFQEAGDLAVKLIREHWANRNGNGYIRGAIRVMGYEISSVAPSKGGEEVDELLRRIVEAVESVPETCRSFPYHSCDPFHGTRVRWLRSQDRYEAAVAVMERGIELTASVIPLPSLEPPGLAEDFLEAHDQDEETRQSVLRKVIQNLDGRSGETFYEGMANIARRLYMQGRTDEWTMLLDAAVSHCPDTNVVKWLTGMNEALQGWQQIKASILSVNSVSEKLSHVSA
jgi:tetratricopeptide (TPR) repeat protein